MTNQPNHSMRAVGLLALATGAAMLLSGCFGARKDQRRYYSFPAATVADARHNAPGHTATKKPTQAPWPGTLQVATFAVSPVHDRVGLVLRRSDVELRYSARDVWVQRPQHLVSDRVAAAMESSGLFRRVVRDLSENSPDWVLRGRVLALEVLTAADGGGPWRARVTLRFELRRSRDGALLWRRSWSKTAPVDDPDPAAAARKIGHLVDRAVAKVLADCAAVPAAERAPPSR